MRTARLLLAFVGLIVLVVAGLVVYVLARNDVQVGRLRREVAPRVLITDRTTQVTLTKITQTAITCPAARRASNVVLVIDHSGSMTENAALEEALGAARAFINTVDLNANRVAVLFFNDLTDLAQPFSQDPAALLAATNAPVLADGGTDIARALTNAGALLRAEPATNATPVILLLTDGGSDPSGAEQVASLLRDEGVRIIAVSLLTTDTNPGLLRDLVSSPDDYHESASPAELQAIYSDLAVQLNQAVAFDVTLVETPGEALTVRPDSPQPPALVANNVLTWTVPSLSAAEAAFAYTADVGGFGLRPVNQTETTMTYTDCVAGAITATLPPGPNVLVLPPWLLALLAAFLAAPFLLAWFRRPKAPPPQPVAPVGAAPTADPPDRLPAWLRRLDNSRKTLALSATAVAPTAADDLTPTIIIGLGPFGRIVLSQVAQALRARYGGQLPDQVRLLQIDVQPKGVGGPPLTTPDYLEPAEWLLLEPDLAEVANNIRQHPDQWPHMDWFEPTAGEDYARAAGRMALFHDLQNGADRSILWRGLTRLATNLDQPKLRLIGSTFDDVGSGMLVDMAWLMQQNKGSQVDVELWLSGPIYQNWPARVNQPHLMIRRDDQRARTLATLRELERFESNDGAPFHYVTQRHPQVQFRQRSKAAVVQTLYLFAPPDEKTSLDDHLAAMADGLLASLYTKVQQTITQHMNRSGPKANELINQERLGMTSSLGAFSVRLPLGWLDETLTWRAVYETLFEARVGLHPLASLTAAGTYQPADPDDTPDDPLARRESAEAFVARFRHHYDGDAFLYTLVRQVNDRLNGESGGEPTLNRVGGLVKTRRWLQAVRNLLNLEVADRGSNYVRDLDRQLETWQTFLEEQLHPLVERRLREARDQLAQLIRQTGRKWALPDDLEWPAYQNSFRHWLEPQNAGENDPLLRGIRRLGWFVAFDPTGPRVSIQLWAPPGDFVWTEDADAQPANYPLPQEATGLAARLYNLLAPLAQMRSTWQQTKAIADTIAPAQAWLDRAEPRLSINRGLASEKMNVAGGYAERVILVAPREAGDLHDALKNAPGKPIVEWAETNDLTTITVMRVRDRVPLLSCYGLYDDETWREQFTPAGLYIWRSEQVAATLESGGRLSSRFITWLEQDGQLVRQYARAYLFSLLDAPNAADLELPGLGAWPGRTPGEGLENLFSDSNNRHPRALETPETRAEALQQLTQATVDAQAQLWRETDKRDYLRQAETKLIAPLAASQRLSDRDLAIYLRGIIRQL
jgi:Mg-chelatase subunit ChlD